jgi:hypothetical protein
MAYTRIPIDNRKDVPPESLGENQGRLFEAKSARLMMISTADDQVNISEPSSPYHPMYPYNDVEKGVSGSYREIDSTPGAERISTVHTSGTFEEYHPDGSKVVKVFGKNWHITMSDDNIVIGGHANVTIQGNCNLLVAGNMKQKIAGDYEVIVHGNFIRRVRGQSLEYTEGDMIVQTAADYHQRSEGTTTETSIGSMTLNTDADFYALSSGTMTHKSGGDMFKDSGGTLSAVSGGSMMLEPGGSMNINAGGDVNVDGGTFHWHTGTDAAPSTPDEPEAGPADFDVDPTGGLEVADSVTVPSFAIQMGKVAGSDLSDIYSQEVSVVFPMDRVKIEESSRPIPEPLVSADSEAT